MGAMHRTTLNLLAAGLCAAIVAAPPALRLNSQSPPPAAVTPAALDPAALQKKVDELLDAHVKVNDFSGTVLLASGGKPLVAKVVECLRAAGWPARRMSA